MPRKGQIESRGVLVGAVVEEQPAFLRVRLVVRKRPRSTQRVPFGGLDEEHRGAQIGQQLGAVRAADVEAQVEDVQMGQGLVRHAGLSARWRRERDVD